MHYVQGGYYIKGWGKHGPLTNPYAFGFFGHMPHVGNADRLTHTFIVYGGGLLGKEYEGKIIGPNPLMSRITVTRLEREGSTFKTVEEAPMMTSEDGWFRPVDLKTGPDGALYIADFYEKRISHVDPRDTWDRSNGRIWRIRPSKFKPGIRPFDMAKLSSDELVDRLSDKNRWVRATARRVLGDRKDQAVAARLRKGVSGSNSRDACEALWALNELGPLSEGDQILAITRGDEKVARWGLRLVGDRPAAAVEERITAVCRPFDKEPELASQLASTLRRLKGENAINAIVQEIEYASELADDPHVPMLLWWAVESKLEHEKEALLRIYVTDVEWRNPINRNTIMPRLARRLASEPTEENQKALVTMLEQAPGAAERTIVVNGIAEASKGSSLVNLNAELREALRKWGGKALALRAGDRGALAEALKTILNDDPKTKPQTMELIETVGQVGSPEAIPILLEVAENSQWHSIRKSALGALAHFEDPSIGKQIVGMYGRLPGDQNVRPVAIATLTSREAWAEELVKAVKAGTIPRSDVTAEQVERIRQLESPALTAMADETFGAGRASSEEKQREMERVAAILRSGSGDARAGKLIFAARCATCHTLFGEGGRRGRI